MMMKTQGNIPSPSSVTLWLLPLFGTPCFFFDRRWLSGSPLIFRFCSFLMAFASRAFSSLISPSSPSEAQCFFNLGSGRAMEHQHQHLTRHRLFRPKHGPIVYLASNHDPFLCRVISSVGWRQCLRSITRTITSCLPASHSIS